MKILFDGIAMQPVGTTKIHGGGEYSKVIFKRLAEKNNSDDITLVYSDKEYMPQELLNIEGVSYLKCGGYADIEDILENNVYDIFYSGIPYVYKNLKVPANTKFIYTIHGLRYLEKPIDKYEGVYCKGKEKLKFILKNILFNIKPSFFRNKGLSEIRGLINATENRVIITDSNHSKYSIMSFFPELDVDEINVCYAPYAGGDVTDNVKDKKEKYILLISGDRWLKNNYRAVVAIDELYSFGYQCMKDVKTIVLGVADDNIYKNKIKNKDKFLFEGYVEKSELESYEKNAHLFVYPTLNEGFGYPPLDVMKYGTICACSAVTSVTEVCGDAVLYFNPYDINEIKNRVLQSFDEAIREEIGKKIYERYSCVKQRQVQDLDRLVNIILGGGNLSYIFCDFGLESVNNFFDLAVTILKGLINPSKKIMLYYRLGHMAYKKNKKIKAKFYENKIYYKFNCHIRVSAEIGENCIIAHPIGIVIGSGAKIGKNCVLYQGVTIGLKKSDESCYPVIEDGCNIYASAKILGGIKVKKGTSVAANAVLMRDTEENSVYAGVPARKVA